MTPATTILEAFARLDRQAGSYNIVSLVQLRPAAGLTRDAFDRQLRALRISGVLTCSNAEGRHGISGEERAAAIVEGQDLLLFVHRIS